MANRRKSVPDVSPKVDPQLRPLLAAFKEIVETGEGIRGNPLDRKLTVRDLIDSGIGKFPPGSRGGGTIIPGDIIPVPNLSTPPAPTGFEANGGIGYIFLSWDQPRLAYANHGYTEIWRHTADNLANAVLYAQVTGSMFGDLDTLLGTTYYYWVRFISDSNVAGPFNDSNGTPATESESPQELLDRLNGEITELQLFSDLNARIDLIDGPPSLVGSVADRIADEAAARAADISQAYSDLELYADDQSTAAITITQLVTEFGGNTANALDFTVSEVDSQLAVTTTFQQYDAQFTNIESDLTTKANITYVDQAISDEESARASQFNQLSAEVDAISALKNGNFEAGGVGWTQGGNVTIVNDPANARDGSWCGKFTNCTSEGFFSTSYIEVNAGDKVLAQAFFKKLSGTGDLRTLIRWIDSAGNTIFYANGNPITTSTYSQSRVVGIAPSGVARAQVVLDSGGGNADINGYVDGAYMAILPRDSDIGVVPATVSASVTEVNEAVANAAGASASSIAQLSTQHGTNTSTIQVQGNSIDGLEGQYSVKIDVNGQVAGYGLSNTANQYDGSVHSIMLFSVDTFAIGSPGANNLSFIVENGQVVMDAAFIVNLAVTDADIVSVTVGKITGLTASFIEAKIENLSVDKISGDVNTTIEAPVVSGLNLPNVSGEAYREAVTLSIPSQTRPRIPLLFSKAVHSAGSTGNYLTKYKVLIRSSIGSRTDVATPDFITADQMRWETVSTSSSPMSDPAGWSAIGTGDEIGRSSSGVWHYSRVLSASYTITAASGGNYVHRWLVLFEWTLSRGVYSNSLGGSYRVRSGGNRLYQDVVSEGQNISSLTANDETEVNSYVLSLPRSASFQQYVMAILGNGTLEQLQFTALLVR